MRVVAIRVIEPCAALGLVFHQQAADEIGGNLLGGAAEEGLGQVLGGRGGYGSSFVKSAEEC